MTAWKSETVDVWELVAGVAVWVVATTLSGALGFGGGVVGIPFLVLINPEFVPVPLLLQGVVFTSAVTWRERRAVDFPALKWATIGLLPGVALGTWTLTSVSKDVLGLLIGLFLLTVTSLQATGSRVYQNQATLGLGGAIGGFTGVTAAIPLVPLALVMSQYQGPRFRSTLNGWGMTMAIFSVVTLTFANEIDRSDLAVATVLTSGAVVGIVLSGPLRHVVDRRGVAQAVYAVGALGAVALLVRSLT
ncbi:MAG: sulfite exporter TauE/SafE family protein [Actinomycetota bacterium]|nr:sulfite exporter TauE/SafE family protein [Actinomycetota bacterium]